MRFMYMTILGFFCIIKITGFFSRFHKKFTESGDYWVFVSNKEFISHECKLLQTNDPLPAEMRKQNLLYMYLVCQYI